MQLRTTPLIRRVALAFSCAASISLLSGCHAVKQERETPHPWVEDLPAADSDGPHPWLEGVPDAASVRDLPHPWLEFPR